jgi:chromate transport protein ChrA
MVALYDELGEPVAHVGYFRAEFVERPRWLNEPAFTEIVALCQFLPGPASSEARTSLGIQRAGHTREPWPPDWALPRPPPLAMILFADDMLWVVPPWLLVVLGAFAARAVVMVG